ncbi:MAG: Uma2 family endonuclease [Okeania sp. SIO3B5]|uniref:Uma2 family endonuclease n=1 Tax=Okeania sp. SIO3B5 TaxID=2607811 RepID=UPI0013FFC540|nr:Uma2 family endonuclease [Okeania sp. SIO3B5]NEO52807.1 Uma2 family endonuclease [Okeania sp. SIO3B5]
MLISTNSPKQITLEEFLQLPETKPESEYINNKIYQKPMAQGEHSAIQVCLSSAISQAGEPQKLAMALPELRCTFNGCSIVPDVSVFPWQRIPRKPNGRIENRFEIAPDWIIEILSPDQSSNQLINKIIFCLNNGTQLGWLIDSEDESVVIFQPNQQPEVRYDSDNLPILNLLTDWQLSVADLFAWLY